MSAPSDRNFTSGTEAMRYYIKDYPAERPTDGEDGTGIHPAIDVLRTTLLAPLKAGLDRLKLRSTKGTTSES
jgi:hypothetical protein